MGRPIMLSVKHLHKELNLISNEKCIYEGKIEVITYQAFR